MNIAKHAIFSCIKIESLAKILSCERQTKEIWQNALVLTDNSIALIFLGNSKDKHRGSHKHTSLPESINSFLDLCEILMVLVFISEFVEQGD